MSSSTVLADQSILQLHNVNVINHCKNETKFQFQNWEFIFSHDKIIDTNQLNDLSNQLKSFFEVSDGSEANSPILYRLPAMIFSNDRICLKYHTNSEKATEKNQKEAIKSFEINPNDAILGWAIRHTNQYKSSYPWNVIQVSSAKSWKDTKVQQLQYLSKRNQLNELASWDWTFVR